MRAGLHVGTENPRWGRKAAGKLEAAQQVLTRKRRGSNNRWAARETVAAHNVIVVEDLKIANMARRAKPHPDPDTTGAFQPMGQRPRPG